MCGVGEGHEHVLGLAARITAGQLRVAEQFGNRMTECLVGKRLVAIAALAYRKIPALALLALAANDSEGTTTRSPVLSLSFAALPTSTLRP
jgi:hypothetical protein